ncbi:MAG TPA: transporter associated domain-containing protein, partial [Saprospiraceae bacterium]|nr:transporter associated domain-containing protein [Saprospiraceae bacterium]
PDGQMPFPDCSLFVFETSIHPEAILHVNRMDGVLITCDSVKNWTYIDEFFSEEADYTTIAGFVIEKLGKMPEIGDKFSNDSYSFEIVDLDRTKIDKVLVTRISEE